MTGKPIACTSGLNDKKNNTDKGVAVGITANLRAKIYEYADSQHLLW